MCRLTLTAALALCLTPGAVLGARVARDAAVAAAQTALHTEQAEQASADGKSVCCLLSLEPDFKVTVYQAGRAQGDMRKCLLVSAEAKECSADQPACLSRCGDYMKGSRRYRDLLVEKAKKEAAKASSEKDTIFAQADEDLQAALRGASEDFAAAMKVPREQAAAAGKVLETKKSDRAAKETVYKQAMAAEESAQKDSDAKKAAKELAEQQAAAARDTAEKKAQDAAAALKQAADARVAEKAKLQQEKKTAAAQIAAVAVPAECQDPSSASGAQDCCCSIGRQAMRVSGESFVDWETCKGAKAYSKTSILSFPCGYLTPCDKCAYLVCGNGICP